MKHIIKNIRDFAKNQTLFFVLMVLCVVGSSIIMLFSFGVYQNFKLEKLEFDRTQSEFHIYFYTSDKDELGQTINVEYFGGITKGEVEECVTAFNETTYDALELIVVRYVPKKENSISISAGKEFEKDVYSRFRYQNGRYIPNYASHENLKMGNIEMEGTFFTEEMYNSGDKIVRAVKNELNEDGKWYYEGIAYEPVLIMDGASNDVPFPAIEPDVEVEMVYFDFYIPPSSAQYNEIVDTFKAKFGDKMVLDPIEPFYQEDYWLYDTIIMVAVMIAIVAAVNIVILYHYILLKRRKTLAVFMLCGCTKSRAVAMYLAESMLLTVPMYALSAAFYHYLLMPVLEKVFPFISTAYSFKLYALVFAIYVVVCALAMFILSSIMVRKHSIVEVKAGGI